MSVACRGVHFCHSCEPCAALGCACSWYATMAMLDGTLCCAVKQTLLEVLLLLLQTCQMAGIDDEPPKGVAGAIWNDVCLPWFDAFKVSPANAPPAHIHL